MSRLGCLDAKDWKAALDRLKADAIAKRGDTTSPVNPTSVHGWRVSLSIGDSNAPDADVWVFSVRWPSLGGPPPAQLAWVKEAITYLGAPEETTGGETAGSSGARYWIWKAPRP